jgi:hypothetical protein
MAATGMPGPPDDPDRERGLYNKFIVERTDMQAAERHRDCEYFVLDLHHDALAIPAVEAYIVAARESGYHKLASDLERKIEGIGGMVTA